MLQSGVNSFQRLNHAILKRFEIVGQLGKVNSHALQHHPQTVHFSTTLKNNHGSGSGNRASLGAFALARNLITAVVGFSPCA